MSEQINDYLSIIGGIDMLYLLVAIMAVTMVERMFIRETKWLRLASLVTGVVLGLGLLGLSIKAAIIGAAYSFMALLIKLAVMAKQDDGIKTWKAAFSAAAAKLAGVK